MSSTGNGADIGQVLAIVQELASGQREMRAKLEGLSADVTGLRHEMGVLRRDVDGLRRDVNGLRDDVDGLRQQVTAYHASVLGHGVLISDLDGRVRRIERHLDLPPAAE